MFFIKLYNLFYTKLTFLHAFLQFITAKCNPLNAQLLLSKEGIAVCDSPVFSFPFCYYRQPCPKKSDNLLTASILVGIITSA